MGLEATSVGNHEFDEGWHELLRMQHGGCLPDGDGQNNQNSCPDPANPFDGAKFEYLSANVFFENTNRRCSRRTRSRPSRAAARSGSSV